MRDLRHITIELRISEQKVIDLVRSLKIPKINIYLDIRKSEKADTGYTMSLIESIQNDYPIFYDLQASNLDTVKIGNNKSKYTARWISASAKEI
ncbi:MAG: hypothetical protein INQ03_21040 [Candidatus Heimdallarchaeota archaeon]|nr:hypothetical protein [Candidatus Heimdallarchaeota archaeon]